MNTNASTRPVNPDDPCRQCGHPMDDHLMALVVDHPYPAGYTRCPSPGCPCGATWRANTRPSTPAEIAETRTLVRDALVADGVPLPEFLR